MAELATTALPSILRFLFEKLASGELVDFFRQRKLDRDLIDKLETSLIFASKLREDAENKQFADTNVKAWLDKLKDIMYDAQEILDEMATEVLQRQLDTKFETSASKVRNSISGYFSSFVKELEAKIEKLVAKLKHLADQKDVLDLKEGGERKPHERLATTSSVEETNIVGRDDAKKEIVNFLLSDDASHDENVRVIAITGTGGIGKTTLAQLVYKDEKVKEYFDLNAWVCVSQDFDVFRVMKTTLEAITLLSSDIKDLNRLQQTTEEKLLKKKFFLVLDDVWDEDDGKWEELSKPLKSGARGSVVIVTTRKKEVATMMSSVLSYPIDKLSNEDCWSLFTKYAFSDNNFEACPKLEEIGRQIVEKCKGLPLAVKAIGGMLRSNLDVHEWEKTLKSNLWDSLAGQTKILPALSLSYKDLSPDLKQCFVYCSIFPKDYCFSQDKVISLWMAEGLLKENRNQTIEEVGKDYLHALRSRSLLEKSSSYKGASGAFFVMHDLVHDLVKSVSEQYIGTVEVASGHLISSKVRHLSLWADDDYVDSKKFKTLHMPKQLHTFLPLLLPTQHGAIYITNRVLHDLFPILRCLRVLSLSGFINVTKLPKSIGEIKHLRYLNLSSTSIMVLPDSMCKLCNLQTLDLSYCQNLVALPKDMQKLIGLRHLDIWKTHIKEMPVHLGQLQCLQTLTKFVVSKYDGLGIEELGKLTNLHGKLYISELQNVVDPGNALQALLKDKKYLEKLTFEWSAPDILKCQRRVLDNLCPHSNLKMLAIRKYGAESLSDWVGHHLFSNLTSIRLKDCINICSLPPFGQLCSLQELYLSKLSGIIKVGLEFFGCNSSLTKPFGALKILVFKEMLNWERWSFFGDENDCTTFPHLQVLNISNCPKLVGRLPSHLPSLATLEIEGSPQLVTTILSSPAIQDLELNDCNKVLFKELPIGLKSLKINGFRTLECLPKLMVDWSSSIQDLFLRSCLQLEIPSHLDFSSLEKLQLNGCDSLKSFPLDLFPKLKNIEIFGCQNLESFTISEQHGYDIVATDLLISDCPNFVSFPEGGLRAPKLGSFCIESCQSLRSLPYNMCNLLPSLYYFEIGDCPEVDSFSKGGFPSSLNHIRISDCKKLFAKRMEWGLENHPSIRTVIISGKSEDVESFPEPSLLPSSLFCLCLQNFENIKSLDEKELKHLTSLGELYLMNCPNLKRLPRKGFPETLIRIEIDECPSLKKQLQNKRGNRRRKVPNVDSIIIDEVCI